MCGSSHLMSQQRITKVECFMHADNHDADPNPFFYSGSYINVHHDDASCSANKVVAEASDNPVSEETVRRMVRSRFTAQLRSI